MIPWAKPNFIGNEKKFVIDALKSTWVSGGPYVNKFESEFSKKIKSKYIITTSNGTTSLNLALLGLKIGRDDEVIVPDFTFVAPGNVVLQVGATPVFADVDKNTWCIDPQSIENSITPNTKAIIAVHVYGNVCDMDKIMKIAKERNLYVIEDAAESAFSKYKEKYAGTFGEVGCFSFQATKTITMGEGGAVSTTNKNLFKIMKKIRNHGMTSKRYWHDIIGYNYRLTNLQAAIGCAQLQNLETILKNKKRILNSYLNKLKNVRGISFQFIPKDVKPILWAVAIKIDSEKLKINRDYLMKELLKKGIETRPGFYPFSVMPFYNAPKCPIAETISKNIIVLPSFPSLKDNEIKYISESIKELV